MKTRVCVQTRTVCSKGDDSVWFEDIHEVNFSTEVTVDYIYHLSGGTLVVIMRSNNWTAIEYIDTSKGKLVIGRKETDEDI